MSAALHIATHTCRFCRRPVMDSIARHFGSAANGFMCPDCAVKEIHQLHQLSRELTEAATTNVDSDEIAPPCAMCHTERGTDRRLVHIDGRMGFICLACEPRWLRLNREKLGAAARHALKL